MENIDQADDYEVDDFISMDYETLEEYELPRSPTGSCSSDNSQIHLNVSTLLQEQEQLAIIEAAELSKFTSQTSTKETLGNFLLRELRPLEQNNIKPEQKEIDTSVSHDIEKGLDFPCQVLNILQPLSKIESAQILPAATKQVEEEGWEQYIEAAMLQYQDLDPLQPNSIFTEPGQESRHLTNEKPNGDDSCAYVSNINEKIENNVNISPRNLKSQYELFDQKYVNSQSPIISQFLQQNTKIVGPENTVENEEEIDSQEDKELQELQEMGHEAMVPPATSTDDNSIICIKHDSQISRAEEIDSQEDKELQELQELGHEAMVPPTTSTDVNSIICNEHDSQISRAEEIDSQEDKELQELQELGHEAMVPPATSTDDNSIICNEHDSQISRADEIDSQEDKELQELQELGHEAMVPPATSTDDNTIVICNEHDMPISRSEEIDSQVDKELQELQELGHEAMVPPATSINEDNSNVPNYMEVNRTEEIDSQVHKELQELQELGHEAIVPLATSINEDNSNVPDHMEVNRTEEIDSQVHKELQELQEMGHEVMVPPALSINEDNSNVPDYGTEEIDSQVDNEISELQELGLKAVVPNQLNIIEQVHCDNFEAVEGQDDICLSNKEDREIHKLQLILPEESIKTSQAESHCVMDAINLSNGEMQESITEFTSNEKQTIQNECNVACEIKQPTKIEHLENKVGNDIVKPTYDNIDSEIIKNQYICHTVLEPDSQIGFILDEHSDNDTFLNIENDNFNINKNIIEKEEEIHMLNCYSNNDLGETCELSPKENISLTLCSDVDVSLPEADRLCEQLDSESAPAVSGILNNKSTTQVDASNSEEGTSQSEKLEHTPTFDDMDYIDDIEYDDRDPYLTQSPIKSEDSDLSPIDDKVSQVPSQDSEYKAEHFLDFSNNTQDQELKMFSELLLPQQPFVNTADMAFAAEASELEATLPNESMLSQTSSNEAELPEYITSAVLPYETNISTKLQNTPRKCMFTQTDEISTFAVYTQTELGMAHFEKMERATKRCAEEDDGPAKKIAHKSDQKKKSPKAGKLGMQVSNTGEAPVRKSLRLGLSRCAKFKK